MRDLAPVVIFVYNRLDKTQNLLQSLENCILSKDTEVFIYSDGYKAERKTAKLKVDAVRAYLKRYMNSHHFKRITLFEAEKNRGLADSVIMGVTEIINKYNKVIVLEDDLVVSCDFLLYMNKGLNFYANAKSVWSISGYTDSLKELEYYPYDVYATYRVNSWGWGTWRNRWERVDWDVKDYTFFRYNIILQMFFNKGSKRRSRMLIDQMNGKIDSWAARWDYSSFKNNMITVRPKRTRVINCGFDGSGVHCGLFYRNKGKLSDDITPCHFKNIKINKAINKEFCKLYSI